MNNNLSGEDMIKRIHQRKTLEEIRDTLSDVRIALGEIGEDDAIHYISQAIAELQISLDMIDKVGPTQVSHSETAAVIPIPDDTI